MRSTNALLAAPALVIYWLSFYAGALLSINMASLPYLAKSFSLGDGQLAKMLSALAVGGILALWGARYSDRLGRRRVLLACALLSYPLLLASALAPSLWVFIPLQIALGGLLGTIHITTMVAVEEHLPLSFKAKGQAWVGAIFVLGNGAGLISVNLAAYFIAEESWRYVWLFFCSAIFLQPLLAKFLSESHEYQQIERHQGLRGDRWLDLFSGRHRKLTLSLFAALLCWDIAQSAVNSWLIYHPVENLAVAHEWVTSYLIIGGWPALLGFALGVWLRERLGGYALALSLCCALSLLGNFVYFWVKADANGLLAAISSAYVLGLLMANALLVNVRLLINERYPTQMRASMQSIAVLAMACSSVLSQLAISQLIAPLGGLANAISALLMLKILAALIFIALPLATEPATRLKTKTLA